MDDKELHETVDEIEEEIDTIAEKLRSIDDHHKYEHVLEEIIRRLLGKSTNPDKEGSKCTSASLASVRQAIARMTAEVTGYPNPVENKEDLGYIG